MSNQMTPVGVPSELVFDLPASMLNSRKIEQRIQPYSQSTYTSAGQVAKFTIPQTDRTLISGQTMYLTGQLDLANLGTAGTDTYSILGSYYSLFSRQVVNANGTVLETIERPGELVNMLLNMTMNSAEKMAQTNSFGCSVGQKVDNDFIVDATTNLCGPLINVINATTNVIVGSANNRTVTFAIPIVGVLDAVKYLPMWNSNIDLELTVNAIQNWLVNIAGTSTINTGATPASFTLSNLELVFDSIELSPESFGMVMANYPQKVVIKSQSYLAGTGALANGVSGGQDISINARLSSLKQLFFYFSAANCADQSFGGVNPNGQDVVFVTNGQYYPQRPVKLTNPSEVYMQIQKSFGSIKSYSHSGSIGKTELCVRNTGNSLYNSTITNKANLQYVGNKFYLAIDTEIINTNKNSLYNGIQTGVNSNIRLNIADALSQAITVYYWCSYDALLEFDFTTGITRAIY
jgi:hypothetical protein